MTRDTEKLFDCRLQTEISNCYIPVKGGYQILIDGSKAKNSECNEVNKSDINNVRLHRRPLYPPADKKMIWNDDELKKLEHCCFRPLILAYNEPRFLFDYHSAGGLLGHLFIGLSAGDVQSRWFHSWNTIDAAYIEGRMEYTINDPLFPDTSVLISAAALSHSAGLIVRVEVNGLNENTSLVYAYGGASAFFTNWAMDASEFTYTPNHCRKDIIRLTGDSFVLLRQFDKTDVCMNELFMAARYIPEWKAEIKGGGIKDCRVGFGDPDAVNDSPDRLLEKTEWNPGNEYIERSNCIAVCECELGTKDNIRYIVVGMGGNADDAIRNPEAAWNTALERNSGIAERVITKTPDSYLDSAVGMMAFATEGTWGDECVLHGAWSWRSGYLGWRGWYGPVCYGWLDRIRKSIINHVNLGLIHEGNDAGALGNMLENGPVVYYNMNEVFIDHVRQYFEYTDDIELMKEIFPVLEGIVNWEDRRLRPGEEPLYENCLNTWISDSHWYVRGQCTQASAYMLRANELLANLAVRLEKNPYVFLHKAESIHEAMLEKLWMTRKGVFAEYRDTSGNCMLHTEPELSTIYLSAEFGAADAFQVYQMLYWTDNHLESVATPGGGKMYWSSNWYPNNGRSYTHSTYDLAYAEELNYALTNYIAGRSDEAYSLLKGTMSGIFNGPTPGGLSCHSNIDGSQRANDEFSDAISMWGRTVIEGLFGIVPKRPDGIVELSPQFPQSWNSASIRSSQFSYDWECKDGRILIKWQSPVYTVVKLKIPLQAEEIREVMADQKPAEYSVQPGICMSWILVQTSPGMDGNIVISYKPAIFTEPDCFKVKKGESFNLNLNKLHSDGWIDPQGILSEAEVCNGILKGTVIGDPGQALLFVSGGTTVCPRWIPVKIYIEPVEEFHYKIWKPPVLPARDIKYWSLVDLAGIFNASSPVEAIRKVTDEATLPLPPKSVIGFEYWKEHLLERCIEGSLWPSDSAWREKAGDDNIAWTNDGIPFLTSKAGQNIGIITLAGGYPENIEFQVGDQGERLYLMISGITFPNQSHIENLRVILNYCDGVSERVKLFNTYGIGDCWGYWFGRFHDTPANGFENIGGRLGPGGSSQIYDMSKPVEVDTEAHILKFDLRPGIILKSVHMEAMANDVIYGIMGATILKLKENDHITGKCA